MKFVYPEFLWALFSLAIPIIIHLFNFRKYKILYFSSLKFIQRLEQQTRSTQRLKHLLVFALRLLALTALIIAFAQPYKVVEKSQSKGGSPVLAIYIDNSFSMTAKGAEGELISEACETARGIISKAAADVRVLLNTNTMGGLEQRLITKAEALEMIDKIKPIALNRTIDNVIDWQRSFLDREEESGEKLGSRQYLILSDFQKSTSPFKNIKTDEVGYYYPIQFTPQEQGNLFIDSVWFSTPIHRAGQNSELTVRIINSGKESITNAELSFQSGAIRRDVFVDLPAGKPIETVINFTEKQTGYQSATLTVNDKQLFWDDDYYFSWYTDSETKILLINGEDASPAVSQVYALERFYTVSSINQNEYTANQLNGVDLVFLNGMNELPSSLAADLKSFTETGGTLALFPGAKCVLGSWNSLLSDIQMPAITGRFSTGVKIDRLEYDDAFFYGMFEKKKDDLNLPAIKQAYRTSKPSNGQVYELIHLQNGAPLLMRSGGSVNAFLFASALTDAFGSFTDDALFPAIVLRIAEMSQRKAPNALTIGKESVFPLYKKNEGESPIHLKNGKIDFIPMTRVQGQITYISLSGNQALENLTAGTYSIVDEKPEGMLSLNYDRTESITECLNEDQIIDGLEGSGLTNVSYTEVNQGNTLAKIDIEKPKEYWKLFILFGLIFLLGEMLVLKFWK
ncbi:MAG: hypothetical protein RL632_2102 [Bacteroidota bacterium]